MKKKRIVSKRKIEKKWKMKKGQSVKTFGFENLNSAANLKTLLQLIDTLFL